MKGRMGDQVVADEVVAQQAATLGLDETMEDIGVVSADDAKKLIGEELQDDGNANGNADGVVVPAAASFELQPLVGETPGILSHSLFFPGRVFIIMFVCKNYQCVVWS